MTLHQLEVFASIAKRLNVSQSQLSRELRVSQPAISQQLKFLEADLGGAMFTRNGRGLVPDGAWSSNSGRRRSDIGSSRRAKEEIRWPTGGSDKKEPHARRKPWALNVGAAFSDDAIQEASPVSRDRT